MKDLTKGSLTGHLLQFASFIAITTVFQTLYFLVDLYFVGRLGKESLAGVGLAGNLTMVVLALTQSLGVGATALIAHAIGGKDRARADLLFNQALVLSLLVGLAFGVTAFMARGIYARALAADEATAAQGIQYLTWFVPALMLQFGLVAMGSALRGIGDMKVPTMIQVATVVTNIVLAPVLIVGWGTGRPLGVTGAALASFIAILLGGIAFVFYFRRDASPVRFHPARWAPNTQLWRQMLAIGLPSGGEFALMAVYITLVYHIIQGFGSAAQAGFGIGVRVMQSMFLPAVAIGFATAPVAGQNFGAGLGPRVRQTFYTAAAMSVGVMTLLTAFSQLMGPSIVRIFSQDAAVIAFGSEYLHIASWSFVASGVIFAGSSTLQGMGNTRPALMASAMRLVLFALPAYLLSRQATFEMRHAWYLSVASIWAHLVLLLWLLHRQFQQKLVPVPSGVPSVAP